MVQRRKFSPEFKAQIVLEMLIEDKSAGQMSREHGIKDSVISRWKQEFIKRSPSVFDGANTKQNDQEQRIAELERMIGKLVLELEASKKVSRFLNSR